MRDIKYRGKVCGQWEQATPDDDHWEQFWALVDRETVGQFTGIKDRSGKDIYEDDVCTAEGRMVYSSQQKMMVPGRYTVYWRDDRWHLRDQNGQDYQSGDYYYADEIDWTEVDVIGNQCDTPDLLATPHD